MPLAVSQGRPKAALRLPKLDIRAIWRWLRQEPAAFHLLLFYVAWEYWRPQAVWPVIDVLPWGTLTILAACAAYFLGGERGRRFHPMDGLFLLFVVWVFGTIPFAWNPEVAASEWETMATWVIMYFLVSHVVVTPRRMLLFWGGLLVVFLKMSQHGARTWVERGLTFAPEGVTGSPVWFQNSGEFAMGMVIFTAFSWYFLVAVRPYVSRRLFWIGVGLLPTTALMSVLASSSRGGQLAALVMVVLMVGLSRVRVRALALAAIVLAIGWQVLPEEQKARFDTIGTEDDRTGALRLMHWEAAVETIRERPLFGVGYESWRAYYRASGSTAVQEIHNTFLEAPTELGIPGGLLFLAMLVGSFVTNARNRRRARAVDRPWGPIMYGLAKGLDVAMIGLMAASFFMSVLFWPVYWMNFALTVALAETSRRALAAPARVTRPAALPAFRWSGAQQYLHPAHRAR